MAFMFTDLSGVIRIGSHTPGDAFRLGKGKEPALRAAASACGAGGVDGPLIVPGLTGLPYGVEGYDPRATAIFAFAARVEAHLKGATS